jgi:hypothetical protein
MAKLLTFNEWLKQECGRSESQLTKEYLIRTGFTESVEWTEDDIEDYIESKHHEYKCYCLRKSK